VIPAAPGKESRSHKTWSAVARGQREISEVSQVQKAKSYMFFSQMWNIDLI
jgi:hypothetical protein